MGVGKFSESPEMPVGPVFADYILVDNWPRPNATGATSCQ
jgi:hypothetical protein